MKKPVLSTVPFNDAMRRRVPLTNGLIERICKHVEEGASVRSAAAACGVPYRTLSYWLNPETGRSGLHDLLREKLEVAAGVSVCDAEKESRRRYPLVWLMNGPHRASLDWHDPKQGNSGGLLDSLDLSKLTDDEVKALDAIFTKAGLIAAE